MQAISREELRQRMDRGGDFALVEVLEPAQYRQGHLPGAMNVPLGRQFDDAIQETIPDKNREVVVYCASQQCQASPRAARRMEELGYRNVYDYEAGKADWSDAGLSLVQ